MMRLKLLSAAVMAACMLPLTPAAAGSGAFTLIHTGDIHGHMVPRANLRSDTTGRLEGGLARMYTEIKKIRADSLGQTLTINTGDTLQGSGEALFSRGQAMVDVLNEFGFNAYTPGNWDFLYGAARFEELFKGTGGNAPTAPWGALSSNLYYTNQFDSTTVCGRSDANGNKYKRVLPPYAIKNVGNLKIGILGFTTARAIAAVGTSVTAGYQFTDGSVEYQCYINKLRNEDKVDVLVAISEMEMARDIKLAETYPGVDFILNSDMHERTMQPIVTPTGTVIVEEGQDGTMIGEIGIKVKKGKVDAWTWTPHIITDSIKEDRKIAAKVAQARAPFLTGSFVPNQQVTIGGNTTTLMRPVDEVIAYTNIDLHRSNFVDEDMPGVVEGTSHDLIADAMAAIGQAQSASIRGFRYGTHIPAGGAITMEDIYHYIPIAAKLGRTNKACGADLKFAVENSIHNTFHFDPTQWAGGWMFGYSGLNYDVDACSGFVSTEGSIINTLSPLTVANRATYGDWKTAHGTNIRVAGQPIDDHQVYDGRAASPTFQRCLDMNDNASDGYTVTGYWFADDPTTINNCGPCRGRTIQVVKTDGSIVQVAGPGANTAVNTAEVMDITEAVVKYLRAPESEGGLNGIVTADNLPIHRLTVKRLPSINPYPFKVVQPLRGASSETCPSL